MQVQFLPRVLARVAQRAEAPYTLSSSYSRSSLLNADDHLIDLVDLYSIDGSSILPSCTGRFHYPPRVVTTVLPVSLPHSEETGPRASSSKAEQMLLRLKPTQPCR